MEESYSLPFGYSVAFKLDGEQLSCTWTPDLPDADFFKTSRARTKFLKAYKAAQTEFMEIIATMMNESVVVVGTDGDMNVIEPGTSH